VLHRPAAGPVAPGCGAGDHRSGALTGNTGAFLTSFVPLTAPSCAQQRMACACLFLATKLEESPQRTRDILLVFDRINKRRDGSRTLPLLIPLTRVSTA
jgi:hypothetical protein